LLLDQAFLAGLGNYLRSEILYVAGLPHDVTLGSRPKAWVMPTTATMSSRARGSAAGPALHRCSGWTQRVLIAVRHLRINSRVTIRAVDSRLVQWTLEFECRTTNHEGCMPWIGKQEIAWSL